MEQKLLLSVIVVMMLCLDETKYFVNKFNNVLYWLIDFCPYKKEK